MKSNTMLIVLLVILVLAVLYCNCSKKKERYANVYYNANLDPSINRQTFSSTPNNNGVTVSSQNIPGINNGNVVGVRGNVNPNFQNSKEGFGTQDDRNMAGSLFDAPQYVNYKNLDYNSTIAQNNSFSSSGMSSSSGMTNGGDYDTMGPDFASMANQNKMHAVAKYRSSITGSAPDSMQYSSPKELLPTPDMRQPLMRDPSDPVNFMYDRTIFAPLKTRNHNTPDRIRGDIDIAPIKTGWFDVSAVPSTDLAKGYFGSYNDIQEYQDIQDAVYSKNQGDSTGGKMTSILSTINSQLTTPSLKYARPARSNQDGTNDPFYNDITGMSLSDFGNVQ